MTGAELWRTDGTAAGTTMAADKFPGGADSSSAPHSMIMVGPTLFFVAFHASLGDELWKFTEPVAYAGGPYAISEGGSLSLDGTGSFDPDGDPVTLSWDVNGDGAFGVRGADSRWRWFAVVRLRRSCVVGPSAADR